MKVAWLAYFDPFALSGGGELCQRELILAGRERGHEVKVSAFMSRRLQRALRRSRLHRRFSVDWDSDAFVLADIRNAPHYRVRPKPVLIDRVLATGRAIVSQQAWVDVCPFDMPCGGDVGRCDHRCRRDWANHLYGNARGASFLSPMQERMIASVIDVPLPSLRLLARPMIDTAKFQPTGVERDIDVLYVGTISKAKGYYNLLNRFGPDRLTLVGNNALGEPVEGNYLGHVDNTQLPALYSRARIFAHLPEWFEPMGRAVVEAGLCGCELVLNERVGVTSYPKPEWTDPMQIAQAATRFWEELEDAWAA